ncbi:hypothetical protein ACH4S8_40155 [Streptomyces sp. NPDC021080]|uniref:hypothetical protein n=1 Tax=Streptomyces sp. NPDC021080 TaxID=3365110 RepID=UPI0037B3A01F
MLDGFDTTAGEIRTICRTLLDLPDPPPSEPPDAKLKQLAERDILAETEQRLFALPAAPGRGPRLPAAAPALQRWYPVFRRVLFILTGGAARRSGSR